MSNKFIHEKNFEHPGDISKFINYRINCGLDLSSPYYGKVTLIEKESNIPGERKIIRTIRKDITAFPEFILKAIEMDHFYIDEEITINREGFTCRMKSPNKAPFINFFEFEEIYFCRASPTDPNYIIATLKVNGTHHTPFKKTIEDLYVKERMKKLQEEFAASTPDIYEDYCNGDYDC